MRLNSRMAIALALFALALLAPQAALAGPDVSVMGTVRLEASANVDAGRAVEAAGRSQSAARKLVVSSRTKLLKAYHQTRALQEGGVATAKQVSRRFAAAVRRNSTRIARLRDERSGALRHEVASALAQNVELQGQVALGLAATLSGFSGDLDAGAAGRFDEQGERLGALATQLLDAAERRDDEAGARMRQGLARGLEAGEALSRRAVELESRARGEARERMRASAQRIAGWIERVRAQVEGSSIADARVDSSTGAETTLGTLSAAVAASASANAGSLTVSGEGSGEANGSLSVPPLR